MTTTALDTNALLAIIHDDEYASASEQAIRDAYRAGRLVVAPVVYAELAADGQFDTSDALDTFLSDFSIEVVPPSTDALFRAGEAFDTYVGRRPAGLQCPDCGTERTATCPTCGRDLTPRQHVAADFVIGGHAATDADALVTFDASFYETYFPALSVLPESA